MKRTAAERERFVAVRAAQMIANPTYGEQVAWEVLKSLGFARQFPIQGFTKNGGLWTYILDFFTMRANGIKLCVEIDGGVHKKRKGRDRRRDMRLAGEGIRTIRASNSEVLKSPDKFRERVMEALRA